MTNILSLMATMMSGTGPGTSAGKRLNVDGPGCLESIMEGDGWRSVGMEGAASP